MKKITSTLLALVMVLSLVSLSALAAGTAVTVTAPDTLPAAGETFTVTVDISGNPGLCAAQFTLGFDESVVACERVSLGTVLSGMLSATNPNAEGGAIVAAAGTDAKTGDGTLSTYTFKVLKSGDANFALTDGVFTGADGGKITTNIAAPEPTQPPTPPQPEQPTTPTQPTEPTTPTQPTTPTTPTAGGGTEPVGQPQETTIRVVPLTDFIDMESHWGEPFVQRAVEMGLFTGYPDGTFKPDATISRADFVTVLWRSAGSPEPKAAAPFADVPANAYYAKAVAWAKENGYVDGTGATSFDPAGALQRQAAMKILFYYSGGQSGGEVMYTSVYDGSFADSGTIASWAKAPMYWAYYNGIISGVGDNCLSPQTAATRAQMAKILVNYLEQKG